MSDPKKDTEGATPQAQVEDVSTAALPAQQSPVVAQPVDVVQDVSKPPYMVLPLWFGIIILSYMLYKFGKLRVAERVKRWLPLGYVALWSLGFLVSGVMVIQTSSTEWLMFGMVSLALLVFLNASWLKSILAGVALTLEHHLEVGDSIRLGELEGDLVHFGLRSTRLRAVDGTLHDIPHEQLLTRNVANLSGDGSDSACKIGIKVPSSRDIEEMMELALEIAILSPLASPRHKPEVFLETTVGGDDPSMLYIRGYAFDPNYQEHFKSDVLKRLAQAIEHDKKALGLAQEKQ